MQSFINRLSSAAESIRSAEEKRKALADFLAKSRDSFSKSSGIMEEKLIYKIAPQNLSGKKILAVDGGLSQHHYHGLELALLRAVAVLFQYDSRGKAEVSYYPDSEPQPEVILITDPQESGSLDVSNERMQKEAETAASAAKKFSPDLLLMDGMIVPHINDIPKESSASRERFKQTIENFRNLYNSGAALLAGCIEDSRGKRFCELLAKNGMLKESAEMRSVLEAASDTNILFYLLDYGERTCAFRFSEDVAGVLGKEGSNIYSFYMKAAKLDRPLRVDFYSASQEDVSLTADKIASLILPLCCHDSYGFPAPLIEADFRAKLPEDEVEKLRFQILDRIGLMPSLMKMRRELRPL